MQGHNRGPGGPPFKKPRGDGGMNNGGNFDHMLERADEKIPPNHILLITVFNAKFAINVEVIYKVCSIVGKIKKIVCFERMNVSQAMVEFETLETASKARTSLHGCDIYNNCCTMKVEYSKMETLQVRENNNMSWDFTDGSEPEGRRPVILNSPDFGGYGGGYPMGGGNMQGGNMGGGNMGPNMGGGNMGQNMGGGNMGGGNMGGPNMGGGNMGGGNMNAMVKMPNHMGDMGMGNMGGGGYDYNMGNMGGMGNMDDSPCVMLVYGLEPPKWNCDRLFNLICQYGNVNKIFFMKNKPNTAMVEMGTPEGVENIRRNLCDLEAFGERLRFDVSKKHMRITNPPSEFVMEDGSSSVKEFYNERHMNRFVTPAMAAKNRIIRPSKVLHFFNILKIPDTEFENMFSKEGAAVPIQIKWVPCKNEAKNQGVGLCYFNTAQEATEALILVSHSKTVDNRNIKFCYSPAKY